MVLKYLDSQRSRGLLGGVACGRDILKWARAHGMAFPGKRPLVRVNMHIHTAISRSRLDRSIPYHLEEVEGWRPGVNFLWRVR